MLLRHNVIMPDELSDANSQYESCDNGIYISLHLFYWEKLEIYNLYPII